MSKFILINKYARIHRVHNWRVRQYAIRLQYRKFFRMITSKTKYRLPKGKKRVKFLHVRDDFVLPGRERNPYPNPGDPQWAHTVFLPGGIKKVLEPHEYKSSLYRK